MMDPEKIVKEPTRRTPWVVLEPGRIFFMGRSIPDNPGDFYRPLHAWVSEYVKSYDGTTRIEFGFEYINTSSTKWIFGILRELAGMKDLNRLTSVKWYYEEGDDDMEELGYMFQAIIECPFSIIEIEEMSEEQFRHIFAGPVRTDF
jgi:hypothetical protein